MYGGYSAVAICEMVFAIIFFCIFMMDLDKQVQVVNWVWSVSVSPHDVAACRHTRGHRFTMLHLLLPSFVQDLFRAAIGAALYIITSLICVIGGAGDGARIAGGVSLSDHIKRLCVCICLIVGVGN